MVYSNDIVPKKTYTLTRVLEEFEQPPWPFRVVIYLNFCARVYLKHFKCQFFFALELSIPGNDTSILKTKLQLGGKIPKIEQIDMGFPMKCIINKLKAWQFEILFILCIFSLKSPLWLKNHVISCYCKKMQFFNFQINFKLKKRKYEEKLYVPKLSRHYMKGFYERLWKAKVMSKKMKNLQFY